MQEKSTLHLAALEYIAKGYELIPCSPDGKIALAKNWTAPEGKLRTAAEVDACFAERGDVNLAICPEDLGLAVVDADTYKHGSSVESLNLPPTYEVQTPRGGTHFYFVGSVPPTVGKPGKYLGEGIDTRGRGSYVLIPPSVVEGKPYVIKSNRSYAALPAEIEARVTSRADAQQSQVSTLDLPGNISTARARLADLARRGTVAVSGRGGNNVTYQTAVELVRDLGLSAVTAYQLMLEVWNPSCVPPWDKDELAAIVSNAASYGQNAPGAYAAKPASETFAPNLTVAQQTPTQAPNKFRFHAGPEMHKVLPPKWIVRDLIPENSIVLLTASKGSFKTFLAMDVAQSIATGTETFGSVPEQTGPTFYGAHEGIYLIEKIHRDAWCAARGFDPTKDTGFYVAPGPRAVVEDDFQFFGEAIQAKCDERGDGKPPKLIVLDTYSQCMMGLDENNPGDIYRFIKMCQSLLVAWPGAAIVIPAHTGKDVTKGTRGSSALEAAVDVVIDLTRPQDTLMASVKVRHMRGAMERKSPWRFQGRTEGESLVFDLMPAMEFTEKLRVINILDRHNVASILRGMGAITPDNAIATLPLAMMMTPQEPGELGPRYDTRVKNTETSLRRMSQSSLSILTSGKGATLRWFVPAIEDEPDDPDGL